MPNQRANRGTRLDQKKIWSLLVKTSGGAALNSKKRRFLVRQAPFAVPSFENKVGSQTSDALIGY